jgi:pilus assembly protein Flp/PilA
MGGFIMKQVTRLYRSSCRAGLQSGQGLIEYALILVLVAVVVISILSMMGPAVGNVYSQITVVLVNAATPGDDNPCILTGSGGNTIVVPPSVLAGSASDPWFTNANGFGLTQPTSGFSDGILYNGSSGGWRPAVVSAQGDCSPYPNR